MRVQSCGLARGVLRPDMRVERCVLSESLSDSLSCACSRAVWRVECCVLTCVWSAACGNAITGIVQSSRRLIRDPLGFEHSLSDIVGGLRHSLLAHRAGQCQNCTNQAPQLTPPFPPEVRGPPGFLAVGTIKRVCSSIALRCFDRWGWRGVRDERRARGV